MEGAAIVLYSSDLDEVLLLATRVLVMYGGTVVETPLDREEIGRAMLGVA
jgi:simple sugar transport system ATP-binding protein